MSRAALLAVICVLPPLGCRAYLRWRLTALCARADEGDHSFVGPGAMTPASMMPGALAAVGALSADGRELWIVSFCGMVWAILCVCAMAYGACPLSRLSRFFVCRALLRDLGWADAAIGNAQVVGNRGV